MDKFTVYDTIGNEVGTHDNREDAIKTVEEYIHGSIVETIGNSLETIEVYAIYGPGNEHLKTFVIKTLNKS